MKFKSDIEAQADILLDGALADASGSPGTVNQLLSSTVTGTTWIDPSTIVAEAATVVVIACKNTSGATIAKGTPVYQTGTVGATATIEIAPADALISTGGLPAIGLMQTALNNNGLGFVVISGALINITTSPIDGVVPVTGDKVFLKSGGGLTLTKPTGSLNGIQNLGLIGKVAIGSAGTITVSSIMRTNDVPNLPTGRTWVGNSNTEVSQTVYIDEPNLRLGIGTTSPSTPLSVNGAISAITSDYVQGTTGSRLLMHSAGTGNSHSYIQAQNSGGTSSAEDLALQLYGGNVGIGTGSPDTLLNLEGVKNTSIITLGSTTNDSSWSVGDKIGAIDFYSSDASGAGSGIKASISYEVEAGSTGSTNSMVFRSAGTSAGTNNTERMRIDSTGNVGIGTDSPDRLLHLKGTLAAIELESTGVGSDAFIDFQEESVNRFRVGFDTSVDCFKIAKDNNNSNNLTVNYTTGNVGIGTTSPGQNLEINDASTPKIRFGRASSYYWDIGQTSSDFQFQSQTGGTIMHLNYDGNVGIGTTSPDFKLDVAGSIRIEGDGALLFGDTSTSPTWGIGVVGNDLAIDSTISGDVTFINSGNVGIGTTSPDYKLQVATPSLISGSSYSWPFDLTREGSTTSRGFSIGVGTAGGSVALGNHNGDISLGQTYGTDSNGLPAFYETMRISHDGTASGGNVGIGTTSPGDKLVVQGDGDGILVRSNDFTLSRIIPRGQTSGNWDKGLFSLYNAAAENVRIDTAGNSWLNGGFVGIGTSTPDTLLNLYSASPIIRLESNDNSIVSGQILGGIEMKSIDASGLGVGVKTSIKAISESSIGSRFGLAFSTTSFEGTVEAERMRIDSGGNVGIGTTSPQSNRKLDVAGHIQGSQNFYLGVAGTNLSSNSIEVGQGRTGNGFAYMDLTGDATYTDYGLRIIRNDTGANASSQIVHRGTGDFSITTSESADILLIPNSGNVGVGTTSPQAKLDVAGGIRMSMDTSPADSTNVGTLRYYSIGNSSYVDMCMQTSATAYAWVNIVQNNW